jgi:DNA replication protein DnaC
MQAVQDLYDIISERYEHGSIVLTSNRTFEEWAEPLVATKRSMSVGRVGPSVPSAARLLSLTSF